MSSHGKEEAVMPRKIYARMSAHGQLTCRLIAKVESEEGRHSPRLSKSPSRRKHYTCTHYRNTVAYIKLDMYS